MNKCQICLNIRTNLFPIFDCYKNAITFAEMINSITNIRVENQNEAVAICRICKRKLIEAYHFKNLIESSYKTLYQSQNPHTKRIYFSNIAQVKIKIEPVEEENKEDIKYQDIAAQLANKDAVNYNNTTIRSINNSNTPMTVLDFLNTLDPYDSNCDDYAPTEHDSGQKLKRRKYIKSVDSKSDMVHKKRKRKPLKITNICIRPVIYNDLKLVYHVPPRKPRAKKDPYNTNPSIVCPVCGILTKSKSHILIHTGDRSNKCEVCAKGFFTEKALQVHMKCHVEDRQQYQCNTCLGTFRHKSSLLSHMAVHTNETKYVCRICSKAFKRKAAMKRHELTHNWTYKNVKCDQCNMSFFSKESLRHHMRVHTGERPFKCEICSQPYSYKHDFNRHCFNKHGVYLKRRSVYVMNEEVLQRERIYTKKLLMQAQFGNTQATQFNPYNGPHANVLLEMALKDLQTRKIPIEFQSH